jgi:hypothetical protein
MTSSNSTNDAFLVKLDGNDWQTPLWSKRFGDASSQYGWGVAVGQTGAAIVGGGFFAEIRFGAPLTPISSTGGMDLYGARLAP